MAEGSGDQNSTENAAPAQNHSTQNGTSDGDYFNTTWGLPANEVYRLALTFFKEKEGKAMHLTYKDKLKLVALTKQVAHGKYRPDGYPEVGFLDVVGNDRKLAWQSLGDMSKESAMTEFVRRLDELCPLFKPHVQAHKTELEEQERKKREEEEKARQELEEKERQKAEEEARQQQELEQQRQYEQEMQMRAALNQQTAAQFKQYAEHQYPDNKEMQEVLVRQLQEQHFQQYMQQVYQQQLIHQQQQYQQLQAMQKTDDPDSQIPNNIPATNTVMPSLVTNGLPTNIPESNPSTEDTGTHDKIQSNENDEEYDGDDEHNEMPPISAASMWTRKDLKDFKDSIRKDPDSVIKVGSGETVTVRVPTHEDGTCLFWEFATDHYDIGFGVYFEWTIAPSSAVSVHVSESSDDEDIEEEEVSSGEGKGDVEQGSNRKEANHPPTDEIIPVYRRDCHEEVYCGSHMYPGRGVYLLKFDNSYSLWRSKTLYYRVYYTR